LAFVADDEVRDDPLSGYPIVRCQGGDLGSVERIGAITAVGQARFVGQTIVTA